MKYALFGVIPAETVQRMSWSMQYNYGNLNLGSGGVFVHQPLASETTVLRVGKYLHMVTQDNGGRVCWGLWRGSMLGSDS